MLASLAGIPGKLYTLLNVRLTFARANGLDNITAGPVALASTALTTANLTNLDAAVSSVIAKSKSTEYTTGSSGNFTPGTGVSMVWVTMQGGGGGGGKATTTNSSGGGAGGYMLRIPYPCTAGVAIAYVVGTGGAGATVSGTGTAGGDTTFGSYNAGGGGGGQGIDTTGLGGSGGGYGTNDWASSIGNTSHGTAGVAVTYPFLILGGASGAGSAGTNGGGPCVMNAGGSSAGTRGGGGASIFGSGGSGGGAASTTPTDPTGYGCGGGGCGSTATRAGNGKNGYILVEWIG